MSLECLARSYAAGTHCTNTKQHQTTAKLTDVGIISSHINCNIDSQNVVANNMRSKMQQLVNFQLFPSKWTSIGHVIRFVSVYSHLIQLLDSI